ncbi:heme-binding protein 2 isoform X2 [Colossoma macropomum]|uniref:heme-binding protein 2 isoform X1 n=1 Tax=Colossoma macropomum TaxID=42526 RepID=UPI001864C644|nr:heme-binding protein 2 isoform X1 [Colossoma macropomum]XP_036423396.1 heme-binding protein 2 isoform X2 [Colossoma macropomum]
MIFFAGAIVLLLTVTAEARVGNSTEPNSFCTETKECLLFDLICEGDGYEVRHYEASKWVATEVNSHFMEFAVMRAFRKLFKYITGENEAGVKIEMTAPVITKVKEDGGMLDQSVYILSFLLPSAYQNSAPEPTDSTVYLTDMPDMNVYVKTYGGWTVSATAKFYSYRLKQLLDKVKASYNKEYHYNVGYNSPMKLMNRHNEVWYVVEGTPVCSASE